MKLLLDTHILLWALLDDPQLSAKARRLILDEANECFFSSVSLSEMSIKHRRHPDAMPLGATDGRSAFIASGFHELSFDARHASALDVLDDIHSDPFDRMLICQAKVEGMKLLSHDGQIAKYGDFVAKV